MNAITSQTSAADSAQNTGDLRVVLTMNGKFEWAGSFMEFVKNNEDTLSILNVQQIYDALMRGETYTAGGGAAPVAVLRVEHATPAIEELRIILEGIDEELGSDMVDVGQSRDSLSTGMEALTVIERQHETMRAGLRNIRKCIDGSQPIDTTGATMAIDHLLSVGGTNPISAGYVMDEREHATVLAALAFYHASLRVGDGISNDILLIASNAGKVEPLTSEEMNELSERLNVSGGGAK